MRARHVVGIVALVLAVALAEGLYPASPRAAADHRVTAQVLRTASCATEEGALQLWAFATNPTIGSANVTISTGNPARSTGLLGVSSQLMHFGLGSRCHFVAKPIVLNRRGLTSAGTVRAGDIRSPTVYCAATRRVLLRLEISYDSSERPVTAAIEVLSQPKARSGKKAKSKRIGFVQWSPKRSVTYYSSACTSQS